MDTYKIDVSQMRKEERLVLYSGLTKEEAERICKESHYFYTDEEGFTSSMRIAKEG